MAKKSDKMAIGGVIDTRWWAPNTTPKDRATKIQANAQQMWNAQRWKREDMKRALRSYGNYPYAGIGPRLYSKQNRLQGRALSFNVTKAVIDTFVSQLTKEKVKTTVQPIGADWETTQKCRKLETFLDGIAYQTHSHEMSTQAALDAAVFGTGFLRPVANEEDDAEKPRVDLDRIWPWDVLVDPLDGMHGRPATMYVIRWMDRITVRDIWGKGASRVLGADAANFDDGAGQDMDATIDMIPLVMGWHLRRGNNKGVFSLCCGNEELEVSDYTRRTHELVRLVRASPIQGFFGESLALELEPIQTQINILLDKIRRSHHLLAAGYWLVEEGSNIISNHLTNQIGHILRYRGTMPRIEAPNTVAVEIYQHLDRLYNKAFELAGVNQMMAQSKQPSGDYSGRAKLVDVDIQSQRFAPSYELFQNFTMDLSREFIAVGRTISESNAGWSLPGETKRGVWEAVKWADVDLDDDCFTVRLKPTNALADDPQGLLETATEMVSSGMIEPKAAFRILTANEDWASLVESHNASYNLTMQQGDAMLNRGEFHAPEPEMNLDESIEEIQMLKLNAIIKKAPQDRIDLLDRWLVRAVALNVTKKAAMAPPPAPPGPQMVPGMPPGPGGPPQLPQAPPPGMAPGLRVMR